MKRKIRYLNTSFRILRVKDFSAKILKKWNPLLKFQISEIVHQVRIEIQCSRVFLIEK